MASGSRNGDLPKNGLLAWLPRSMTYRTSLVAGAGALCTAVLGSIVMVLLHGSIWAAMPNILAILGVAILSVTAVIWTLREMLAPIDELERALDFYRENGVDADLSSVDCNSRLVDRVDGLLSNMRAERDQIRDAADTDPLTGLLNRRGFDRYRQPGEYGSIIFIDLDRFKHINDTLGHDAGDVVLATTAELLRSVLREGELVARFGGEEFVVFLPSIDRHTAYQVAERIRVSAERSLATELGRVTISAGVAEQHIGESFADALVRADRAAYLAKTQGRNRVHLDEAPGELTITRVAATAAE